MGNKRIHRVSCAVTYGTDGISLTAAQAGMAAIDCIMGFIIRTIVANGPVTFTWDPATALFQALKASNSETDAGTVFTVDFTVMGS